MSIFDIVRGLFSKQENRQASFFLPNWNLSTSQGQRPFPELVRLAYYFYDTNILLRTIIDVLTREVFRNGITARDSKGQLVDISDTRFKTIVERANDTQSLEKVLRDAYVDLNLTGNAFIIIEMSEDRTEIKQIYKANPEFSELLLTSDGRAGITDAGMIMFCVNHRAYTRTVRLTGNEEYDYQLLTQQSCPHCGLPLLPAFMRFYHPLYGYLHYSRDEVVHLKKWSHGIGLGTPPVLTFADKLNLLQAHDYYIVTTYTFQKIPNQIAVLRAGNIKSLESAIQKAMNEAQQHPNLLPIISVDADIPEKLVEVIDLSPKIKEAEMKQLRDEIRSQLSALYGVMPIFTGDLRGVGGLNQEGLQIMVTNRTVEDEQAIMNEALKHISALIYPSLEFTLMLNKNEMRDDAMIQDYNQKVLANVQTLVSLGYEVELKQVEDGRLSYKIIGKKAKTEAEKGIGAGLGAGLGAGMEAGLSEIGSGASPQNIQASMEGNVAGAGATAENIKRELM